MSETPNVAPDLAQLQRDLNAAVDTYTAAIELASEASAGQTRALNRLNQAQKALDEGLAILKRIATRGTDWQQGLRS